jgi:apolipoprotein N-acyltransferase
VTLRLARAGSFDAARRSTIESRPPLIASTAEPQVASAASTAASTSAPSTREIAMILLIYLFTGEFRLETHGPLGTLWVSIGLIAFYFALIWLNTLLGFFLTPILTGIPLSWLLDWRKRRKGQLEERSETEHYQG